MNTENKIYGVLLIESDRDTRSLYSKALTSEGNYALKAAANTEEIFYIIEAAQRDDINFIIINSNFADENFCCLLQRLKVYSATFMAEVILISNDVDEEAKFLLDELSIKAIFSQDTEVTEVIDFLDKMRNEYSNNSKIISHIYDFSHAIKNKNIDRCQEIIGIESFKLFLLSHEHYISLYGEYLILKEEYQECSYFLNKIVKNTDTFGNRFITVSILNTLAKALCYLEKHEEALLIYAQMSTKSPRNLNHKLNVSQVHLANGRWQEALNVLEIVLNVDPKNNEALLKSAQANVGLNRPEIAKSFMARIAGTTELSSLVSFYNNRGVAFARNKEFQKALEFYKNALFFCNKESSKIIFNIGICLLKFNHFEEAIKIFTDLQKSDDFGMLFENNYVFRKIFNVKKTSNSSWGGSNGITD